jgi:hypothetical protein
LKKRLFPLSTDAPFAVEDKNGNLVTDYTSILDVMKEEFTFRLRNREINQEYAELRELKEYLCKLRLNITKTSNYTNWSMEQLKTAIKKLKNNKCKDPHGHINEIYKNMGNDGLASLLDMLNKIKEVLLIPTKLNLSNVSTIYKGKGSKQNVINLRGIFKLPIVRNILDRMATTEEDENISSNMGQFQVGTQKGRNIRDHTLIVHAVVNEAHERKLNVDIQFTDIKQCFDSLWLDETTNDMYDSGVRSRNLNILYEGNKRTQMCVETSYGKSPRVELNNVVMQGSVPGGMICSNQLSKLCNKFYEEGNVYLYRGKIPIPALAMVDDIAVIAECNTTDSLTANIKTDTFVQRKKLEGQTGDGKCQWVHAGNSKCRSTYLMNGQQITQADKYKYLGDYVAEEWNTLFKKRWEKAVGYSATCQAMSTEMSLGFHLYEISKLLHMSIFVNGTLGNMETWPNCTTSRIEEFEKVEQSFMRKILQAHSKTPIEALYLELGVIPLRFHLMKRRILYLHEVLGRDEVETTRKVVMAQKVDPCKGDFYPQVREDLMRLEIPIESVEVENKARLKKMVHERIESCAFAFLIEKAKTHTKVNEDVYKDCRGMQQYKDARFTPDLANLLFKFRTRTYLVKNNFRNNYKNTNILCPLCEQHDDTQEHILTCEKTIGEINNFACIYDDIFSIDMDRLYNVACCLKKLHETREKLLKENKSDDALLEI